nr:translation initiation factor IF-2-like [Ovis aries]
MAVAGSRGAGAASAPGGGVPPFKAAPRRGSAAAAAAGGSEGRRRRPPRVPARAARQCPGPRSVTGTRPSRAPGKSSPLTRNFPQTKGALGTRVPPAAGRPRASQVKVAPTECLMRGKSKPSADLRPCSVQPQAEFLQYPLPEMAVMMLSPRKSRKASQS